jgi:phosphate acetyltransferase
MTEISIPSQHEKYEGLIAATKALPPLTTAVAYPCDKTSLKDALEAAEAGLIKPILVGPEEKIRGIAQASLNLTGIEVIDVPLSQAAAEIAVTLVRSGVPRNGRSPTLQIWSCLTAC